MEVIEINGVVVDQKILDCFSTLGLSPTGDMNSIQCHYRDMVRMVHPDRVRHMGLSWTKDECRDAFNSIRESYQYLKAQFGTVDVPDYDIIYLGEEFDEVMRQEDNVSNFDLDAFNKNFEAQNKDEDDDYKKKGYQEFESIPLEKLDYGLEEEKLCRTIQDLPFGPKERPQVKNEMQLMLPSTILPPSGSMGMVLGETVGDFSTDSCSDLRKVYGENYETWEETAKGDEKMNAKYRDDESIKSRLDTMLEERGKDIKLTKGEKVSIDLQWKMDKAVENTRRQRYEKRLIN